MPHKLRFASLILHLAALALLYACASVELANTWKDPAFAGPPLRSVLVVGLSRSEVNRRIFEDSFTRDLIAAGLTASASHTVLADAAGVSRDQVREAVRKTGADSVLVTRMVKSERKVDLATSPAMPPIGGGFYGWYGSTYAAMPVEEYTLITLESTLWDAKTEKIAWSGTSQTFESRNIESLTDQLSQILIKKMRSDGVI